MISHKKLRLALAWVYCLFVALLLVRPSPGSADLTAAWRSSLYPEGWTPAFTDDQGRFIHDFSYAGYHAGEVPIPTNPPGRRYDVTLHPYNADTTGATDATLSIQRAIDDAGASGGGVVYLPPGTYRISPAGTESHALRIDRSGVVLRGAGLGQTRLFLSTYLMRNKATISIGADISNWTRPLEGTAQYLREDLTLPTTAIPLGGAPRFQVGEWVIITHDTTAAWNHEHNMDCASFPKPCWNPNDVPGAMFYRRVVAVDAVGNTITLDAPTRYHLRTRDRARVYRVGPHIEEVGIESLSIGEQEHPGECARTGNEQDNPAFPCNYETHGHDAVLFSHVVNGWVRNVSSYAPQSNPRGYHLLSDGIVLQQSRHITVEDTDLRRPQNRGGGGNGYLYTHWGNDNLIQRAKAYEGRHNFSFQTAQSNGNVIRDSYAYRGSLNSDFHRHLSHANLVENVDLDQEIFEAIWRGDYGTIPHAQSGTQNVFWNILGLAPKDGKGYSVISDQFGWGLVIGTRGAACGVSLPTTPGRTEPQDILEGACRGGSLTPQSLYLDQLQRRLGTMAPAPGTPPLLGSPSDGVSVLTLGPTLAWTNPLGTSQYHIQVIPSTDDGPAIDLIIADTAQVNDARFAIQAPTIGQGPYVVLPGMSYRWRVRVSNKASVASIDDLSWSPWSEARTFRTPARDSSRILLLSPSNGSVVAGGHQILTWDNDDKDVFYYEVQVSPDSRFGEGGAVAPVWHNLVHGGTSEPLNSWTTPELDSGVAYYWRVRPRVQGDGTPATWAEARRFSVQ
ncbi:MAG: hypothetical protein HW403_316 [Dehalococcoidia bacterium]|nr:hypothetical protein [Dehalococcoidia bacterium]